MVDPVSPIAAAAAGRFVAYLGGELQASDWERLRGSFVRAVELPLAADSEVGSLRKRRGRLAREVTRGAKNFGRRVFTREGTRETRAEKAARKRRREPVERVVDDLIGYLESAVAAGDEPKPGPPERWSAVARAYFEETARAGLEDEDGARRDAWQVVVGGSDQVASWASTVAGNLKLDWILDESLEGFVDQLNADDEFLLTHALVTAGRDVADGVRLLLFVGLPALLLGGGGVALLVLFIDKG